MAHHEYAPPGKTRDASEYACDLPINFCNAPKRALSPSCKICNAQCGAAITPTNFGMPVVGCESPKQIMKHGSATCDGHFLPCNTLSQPATDPSAPCKA